MGINLLSLKISTLQFFLMLPHARVSPSSCAGLETPDRSNLLQPDWGEHRPTQTKLCLMLVAAKKTHKRMWTFIFTGTLKRVVWIITISFPFLQKITTMNKFWIKCVTVYTYLQIKRIIRTRGYKHTFILKSVKNLIKCNISIFLEKAHYTGAIH